MKNLLGLLMLFALIQGGIDSQQPSLHISHFDTEDPCPVGATTTYIFEVRNEGSSDAANLAVSFKIPSQMELVKAQGPTAYEVNSGKIKFAPVVKLPGRNVQSYRVTCRARRPGLTKFQAWIGGKGIAAPILREEATHIVNGRTPAPALHVSGYDTADPCYLTDYADKGQTVHVIELRNEGTAPFSDIVVKNRIDAGLKVLKIKAPSSYQIHAAEVIFAKISTLAPGQKLTFFLTCQATRLGLAKNSITVKLGGYQLTLTNELSTTIQEYRPFRDYGYLQTQVFAIGDSGQLVEDSQSSGASSIGSVLCIPLKYSYQGHQNPYFQLRTALAPQNRIDLISEYFADKSLKTALTTKKMRIPEWQPTTILMEGDGQRLKRYLRVVPRLRKEENPRDIANILLHLEKFYFLNMKTNKLLATAGATGQRISINIPNEGLFEISFQRFHRARRIGIAWANEIEIYSYENMKTSAYKIVATNNIVGNHKYWVWVRKSESRPGAGIMIQAKTR